MAESKDFFVGVADPVEIRKNLLLCSKSLITTLRKAELLYSLDSQYEIKVAILQKTMRELNVIIKNMKAALPKHRLPKKTAVAKTVDTQTFLSKGGKRRVQQETVMVEPKKAAKIDKLEEELAKIEARLADIE